MDKLEDGSLKSIEEDVKKSSNNPPWVELLDSLIELLIEKLPLVDYIRFGAICKQWHLIQKQHRLGHSPKPPLMAASVYLVYYRCYRPHLSLYSPFKVDQKNYRLFLPNSTAVHIIDSCCGWFLSHRHTSKDPVHYFDIYNPVTGVRVQPPLLSYQYHLVLNGSMSAPPTEPNCCIILTTYIDVFVHRLGELGWKEVQVTDKHDLFHTSRYVYVKGKFYRISTSEEKYCSLYVVDPFLAESVEHNLEIDTEEITTALDKNIFLDKFENLVAVDGKLFLVFARYFHGKNIQKGFLLFRASFTEKKWIRVTSIGDYVILVSNNAVSFPANTVEGFKKNTIYSTQKFRTDIGFKHPGTTAFDMDNDQFVEGPSFPYDGCHDFFKNSFVLFWFFPTL